MSEIERLVSKAHRFLRTAELALNDGDFDSCVSRYYAMFFVVQALLLKKGLKSTSHKGTITLFTELYIKSGELPRELGKSLRRAYDYRQKGDYSIEFLITEAEARERLEIAKKFVEQLVKII